MQTRISVHEARDLVRRALSRSGLPQPHVRVIADCLVEAELRGRPTHGLLRLPGIMRELEGREVADPAVEGRGEGFALVDGREAPGYVAADFAVGASLEIAREHRTAVVGVRNTSHSGMLGYFAERPTREGYLCMAMANCGALVAPHGGVDPVLGTNPIAFAIPTASEPIVFDMSTAAITYGELSVLQQRGQPVPEGVAVNKDGDWATSFEEVREGAISPLAGHKGYGLALVCQLLTGAFTGAAPIPQPRKDYGLFFLLMAADLFQPYEAYLQQVEAVIKAVKASRLREGFEEVLLPGERAHRERQERLRVGIEIEEELLSNLRSLR